MANELQAEFERLTTFPDNLSPTLAPPTETLCKDDNVTHESSLRPQKEGSEEAGPIDALRVSQPSTGALDADSQTLGRAQDVGHASTQPIDVPLASAVDGSERSDKSEQPESRYQESSPLEDFMRKRRTSISFHPEVTLDSGHRRPLEEPLPKLAIDTRGRGRSILQDLASHPVPSPLSRTHSEAHIGDYDKVTGELLKSPSRHKQHSTTLRSPGKSSLFPVLQSTAYPIGSRKQEPETEQGASLTSESTDSPAVSEVQTPNDNMDILISPVSSRSPFPSIPYPLSLEDSSAWPKSRRQRSTSRAMSYAFERKSSMRQARRQSSRSSRRSTNSSVSPATAFLSRFAREEQLAPEPDGEGQEVGEYVIGKQVGFGGFSTVKEAYTIEGDERICRAVKIVRKQVPGKDESENDSFQAEFEHEVSLWRCLGHRNILPLIEVYVTDFATFCFTKLNTGGTLFDLVRANRHGVSRDLARRYAYQLASAIRYLHEDVRVVHRDIKLENCLIDVSDPDSAKDGGNLLLCDFGLAEFISSDTRQGSPDPYERTTDRPPLRSFASDTSMSVAGSLQYASPELIMSPAGFLSPVVDIWAYGVVIYALLVGDLPFQHTFQPRVQMMILAGEWNMAALVKAGGVVGYEEEVLEFVAGCLEMESERRWTIAQVLKSRWLDGCQEMLEELNDSWKL